jgi:hypothetical protein
MLSKEEVERENRAVWGEHSSEHGEPLMRNVDPQRQENSQEGDRGGFYPGHLLLYPRPLPALCLLQGPPEELLRDITHSQQPPAPRRTPFLICNVIGEDPTAAHVQANDGHGFWSCSGCFKEQQRNSR